MNNKKSILFFDVDGTLISNDGKRIFPEDAKEGLRKAKENGHLLFINTGRVRGNVEEFIYNDCFDGIVCGCGTNIYYRENGIEKEILYSGLTKEFCREIALKCREFGLGALFEERGMMGYDSDNKALVDPELLAYFKSMNRKMIYDIESPEFVFDKFVAWYDDNSDVDGFKAYMSKYFDVIKRESNFYELVPLGYSKATGIEFLLKYFNISIEDAYVFGDSNNDLLMMKYVKNSIAMGVSSDEVKEIASYITSDVMDKGIYNALKHFGLI